MSMAQTLVLGWLVPSAITSRVILSLASDVSKPTSRGISTIWGGMVRFNGN